MANLITSDDYKEAKGITTSKEDLRIDSLIASVSQLVKTYCNTSFVDYFSSNRTETFTIDYSTHSLMLTETPVVSIVSVSEREGVSESYVALTSSAGEFYYDDVLDTLLRTISGTSSYKSWAKGPGAVQVVYRGGYATIPGDLKLAVVDLITYYLKEEHKERRTIAGASIQNQGSSSQRDNVAFPDHIKRVLDLYKNF
jgi:hypothetical protein